jgi:hypothetical protein
MLEAFGEAWIASEAERAARVVEESTGVRPEVVDFGRLRFQRGGDKHLWSLRSPQDAWPRETMKGWPHDVARQASRDLQRAGFKVDRQSSAPTVGGSMRLSTSSLGVALDHRPLAERASRSFPRYLEILRRLG